MPNINIKKRRLDSHGVINITRKRSVLEACDVMIVKVNDRLEFTNEFTFALQYFQDTIECYTIP